MNYSILHGMSLPILSSHLFIYMWSPNLISQVHPSPVDAYCPQVRSQQLWSG
ncbi:hypothetical protein K438DRAFT_1833238, partial [Mycena galopus ATCC 62051]